MVKKYVSAFDRLIYYLNFSAKTTKQIREKLESNGYSKSEIDKAIKLAQTYDLLNDVTFAKNYLETKRKKYWSGFRIKQKLFYLGISEEIMEENLSAELNREADIACANKFVEFLCTHREYDKDTILKKLKNKGFSYDVSCAAIKLYDKDKNDNV